MDGKVVFFAVFSVLEPTVNEDVQSLNGRFVIGNGHPSRQITSELELRNSLHHRLTSNPNSSTSSLLYNPHRPLYLAVMYCTPFSKARPFQSVG